MALKLVYITIILFLANLVLKLPYPPTLIMVIAGAGTILVEQPSINEFAKKDKVYLVYLILILITINLFTLQYYLKMWFLLIAFSWYYLLYSALKKAPQMFPLVSIIFLISIMSLESPINPANMYFTLNQDLFILELSLVAFWAHKLFPNFYIKVWQSIILRNLEQILALVQGSQAPAVVFSFKNDGMPEASLPLKHIKAIHNVYPLLNKSWGLRHIVKFTNTLANYNYYIVYLTSLGVDAPIKQQIADQFSTLRRAIINHEVINFDRPPLKEVNSTVIKLKPLEMHNGSDIDGLINQHATLFSTLSQEWNYICHKI
jgi:hypothetical protein